MPTSDKDVEDGGTEMFYVDENGNKSDAKLHAEALDNPEADEKFRKIAKARQLSQGMSQEDADLIFGED